MLDLIERPEVYLVGRQEIDDGEIARFLADEGVSTWTTDAEEAGGKLVEVAGRTCYLSFAKPRPGGHRAYVDHVLDSGHGSVLEHAVLNFIITGVSRSFSHELVRHRAGWGYSQLSQRFHDESEARVVVPPGLAEGKYLFDLLASDPDAELTPEQQAEAGIYGEWYLAVERCQDAYRTIADYFTEKYRDIPDKTLRRKRARELARSVLPNATETKLFVTANARALRHFIEMRGSVHADQEIRRVAAAFLAICRTELPSIFGDYALDNEGSIITPNGKV